MLFCTCWWRLLVDYFRVVCELFVGCPSNCLGVVLVIVCVLFVCCLGVVCGCPCVVSCLYVSCFRVWWVLLRCLRFAWLLFVVHLGFVCGMFLWLFGCCMVVVWLLIGSCLGCGVVVV